jgi:hypothetical protein
VGSAVGALNLLTACLYDSSYAVIVGILLAGEWLVAVLKEPEHFTDSGVIFARLHRLQSVCLPVLLMCHLVHPWFVASSMSARA